MSGGVKKTELVEVDLVQLSDEIHKVGVELELLLNILGKKPPKNEGLSGIKQDTEELTFAEKELAKQHQELGRITARLETFNSNYNKEIIKTRVEISNQNATIKQQIVQNNALEGSYDKLNATLNQTIREYKALSQADRENVLIGGEMIKNIQIQDAELKKLDATMGRNQRNVGNYKSGFNGLNFSVMQVGRELPSLAYGFSTFVGAISNNIPMVTDEITRARQEIVRAKAAGEQSTPIWKQLGSAIFSWQTAMVVGLTVLTLYGREIAAWVTELVKGKDSIDKLKVSQERLAEANKKGYEDGQKDIVHLKLLYNATQNHSMSIEEKRKAIKSLQEQYPDYLGKFSEEEILAGRAGKAYYELSNAIMSSAKAKAYEQIIVENEVKKLELETKVLEQRKLLVIEQRKQAKLEKTLSEVQGGNLGTRSVADALMDANENVDKYTESISELNKEISQVEYSSKELAAKIKPTDLLSNLGQEDPTKEKKPKKDKKPRSTKDFYYDSLADEEQAQRDLNSMILKADKDLNKELNDEQKARTEKTIYESVALSDETKLSAQELAIEKIKVARNEKDEIDKIQHELTLFMIDEDIKAQQRILDSANLEADAYANASERIRRLRLQRGEEEIQYTEKTEEQKKQIRNETMQATNALLQQGLDFSQQIYSNQAARAQETYDAEMEAAGDSLEDQTLAKRKFEAEDKKIRQRQAIADKLQAIFNAGLNLALAIGSPNIFAKPILIAAATLGLATAVATPLPQFADGVENFEGGLAVLGDGTGSNSGKELVTEPSGRKWLSSGSPRVYDLASGSNVTPADETRRMLAAMAFDQVREVIDMSETNSHLSKIAKNTKNSAVPYTDNKGRTVIKRGSLTTTL